MKRFFAALGVSALYVLLFFGMQVVVTFAFSLALVLTSFAGALSGGAQVDMEKLVVQANQRILQSTNLILVISAALTCLVLFFVCKARRQSFLEQAQLHPVALPSLWPLLIAGVGLHFFVAFFFEVIPIPQELLESYGQSSAFLGEGGLVWQILGTALCAPAVEEVVFRGFVYTRLKKGMAWPAALALQAAAFGLLHGHILWMSYAFFLGLVLGYVYECYQSLWACVALHMVFNASSFLMAVFTEPLPMAANVFLMAAGALAAAGMLALVWKRRRPGAFSGRREEEKPPLQTA